VVPLIAENPPLVLPGPVYERLNVPPVTMPVKV
jgi:hypothetical protein